MINSSPPNIPDKYQEVQLDVDFGDQYRYNTEEINQQFLKTIFPELDLNISVDDHVHDQVIW